VTKKDYGWRNKERQKVTERTAAIVAGKTIEEGRVREARGRRRYG
jgi:hypothetical protein